MLEAMAGAAAEQHDVAPMRVQVDQEIAVRAILILADPRLAERLAGEIGEAAVHEGAHVGQRIFATRQEIFFFAPPAGDSRFLPAAMPGWADFNGGDMYYGFPDLEGRGVKFAHDAHGVAVDPDTQSREATRGALDEIIAFRDRRFPLLRGAPLTESRVCQYENSSNGDFLIDRHPAMPNVILVGGGSGHGFKHGPEVGRLAAALVSGGAAQPEPRFTLATKAETQHREVH